MCADEVENPHIGSCLAVYSNGITRNVCHKFLPLAVDVVYTGGVAEYYTVEIAHLAAAHGTVGEPDVDSRAAESNLVEFIKIYYLRVVCAVVNKHLLCCNRQCGKEQKQGKNLVMNLGYSHQVIMEEIPGITIEAPTPNKIVISGADKQMVGQFAAEVREKRPPEPYKGKGIKYAQEYIRRKEGKAAKGAKK